MICAHWTNYAQLAVVVVAEGHRLYEEVSSLWVDENLEVLAGWGGGGESCGRKGVVWTLSEGSCRRGHTTTSSKGNDSNSRVKPITQRVWGIEDFGPGAPNSVEIICSMITSVGGGDAVQFPLTPKCQSLNGFKQLNCLPLHTQLNQINGLEMVRRSAILEDLHV